MIQTLGRKMTATIHTMDVRVRRFLERELGFSLETFPKEGVEVRESPARSDKRGGRIKILRIGDSALATGIPRLVDAIAPVVRSISVWELFSPLGIAELRRVLSPEDGKGLEIGFDYTLISPSDFIPAETAHKPVALRKADIPPCEFDSRMRERRKPVAEDFVWAFACYHEDRDAKSVTLPEFGPRCAAVAVIIWRDVPDVAFYGVGTEENYRGQGYGLAVVSAATEWTLKQGAVAYYGASASNIPSLRIARRLGFSLTWETICD
jgi:RimJ/RimL family protein N-acetyltransferase